MRVLIDECMDERFRNALPGHDCQYLPDEIVQINIRKRPVCPLGSSPWFPERDSTLVTPLASLHFWPVSGKPGSSEHTGIRTDPRKGIESSKGESFRGSAGLVTMPCGGKHPGQGKRRLAFQ